MKKKYFWACMLMAPAFVACTDISLSDVNTDVAVRVNDLALPLQVDNIKLSTMLDVDDDSQIKVLGGEYAFVVEGDFQSDPIHVDPIVVKATDTNATNDVMKKQRPGASKSASKAKQRVDFNDPKAVAEYALSQLKQAVGANADEIHEAIQHLSEIQANTHFEYNISIGQYDGLFEKVNQVHLENFTVKAPRGILFGYLRLTTEGGSKRYEASYDSKTGLVTFSGQDIVTSDGMLHIEGEIDGFNGDLLENALKDAVASSQTRKAGKTDQEKSAKSFSFDEEVGVERGEVVVYDTDFKNVNQSIDEMYNSLDNELPFSAQADLEDITINSVSGTFSYDVNDVALEDIDLSDIPDVLSESGTDIRLDNPQIYLYLNNTVIDGAQHAIGATAKMAITANDDKGHSHIYDIDNVVEVDQAKNYIYLSPRAVSNDKKYKDEEADLDFGSAKHVAYAGLSNVLSSLSEDSGLPKHLNINTYDTHVAGNDVQDLALGKDYGLDGHYVFVAPLALSEDSRIKYTDTIDGWGEDTGDLNITRLSLQATATTDVPFELLLRITPIDAEGKRIAETSTIVLPANAKATPLQVLFEGDIQGLDGIKVDATATSKEARALTPDMNISLDGIKIKVSGEYDSEL